MEFVFVVPRSALFADCYPQGFVPFAADANGANGATDRRASEFETAVARDGFFVERAYAERTPTLKQVIPYSIVSCDERVLLTRRLKKGGESRLHDKYSIGIGGHINPQDMHAGDVRDPIDAGTHREIAEELTVRGKYDVRRVGLLNDDSNAVGAVHVGLVQVITVNAPVDIRETEQLEGRLVSSGDLRGMLAAGANFETWSKLLIPHLDELLHTPTFASP
jgi:predicted NUDIX family phosphoesterase